MQIQGTRALITGGSEGIGRAIAAALAAKGAQVGIMGRHAETVKKAADELKVTAFVGDVGHEDDAQRVVKEFVEKMGGIDILVNNAGIGGGAELVDLDLGTFETVFRTNVIGAMLMGREAARRFVAQGTGGQLINISSTSGLSGGKGATAYSGSKLALRGMTEC
nr:SDR family oxidoreductase [Candidatus Krumholzibacteria bacterium]